MPLTSLIPYEDPRWCRGVLIPEYAVDHVKNGTGRWSERGETGADLVRLRLISERIASLKAESYRLKMSATSPSASGESTCANTPSQLSTSPLPELISPLTLSLPICTNWKIEDTVTRVRLPPKSAMPVTLEEHIPVEEKDEPPRWRLSQKAARVGCFGPLREEKYKPQRIEPDSRPHRATKWEFEEEMASLAYRVPKPSRRNRTRTQFRRRGSLYKKALRE
ncbi:hypothetical protein K458DRAFT_411383 [Lentithecium fluviatile CBS 122367]|uniref:Uncharacterized protein n=1 Tax=Lentithecium fluviatile CBS 122367 TaxID=1168545 RepID=A0A6G1JN58_9PLEO|nr:hypothetical protein K458DRAFT_411383 [Lentithecium fluviatile CBS 122367]